MNVKLFRSFVVASALIGVATVAFAAGLDGLKYQKEMTVKLKSGKTVTVMVGEMNGKTLAIIPMEDMNDFYERAEGHSMSSNN